MLLLSGCPPQSNSSHATTAASSSHATSARPAVAEKPAARQPPRLRDDFGLPLVIKIDTPPVPSEIAKPSPPIQEPKAP